MAHPFPPTRPALPQGSSTGLHHFCFCKADCHRLGTLTLLCSEFQLSSTHCMLVGKANEAASWTGFSLLLFSSFGLKKTFFPDSVSTPCCSEVGSKSSNLAAQPLECYTCKWLLKVPCKVHICAVSGSKSCWLPMKSTASQWNCKLSPMLKMPESTPKIITRSPKRAIYIFSNHLRF